LRPNAACHELSFHTTADMCAKPVSTPVFKLTGTAIGRRSDRRREWAVRVPVTRDTPSTPPRHA
jgi:hypothetical protein